MMILYIFLCIFFGLAAFLMLVESLAIIVIVTTVLRNR